MHVAGSARQAPAASRAGDRADRSLASPRSYRPATPPRPRPGTRRAGRSSPCTRRRRRQMNRRDQCRQWPPRPAAPARPTRRHRHRPCPDWQRSRRPVRGPMSGNRPDRRTTDVARTPHHYSRHRDLPTARDRNLPLVSDSVGSRRPVILGRIGHDDLRTRDTARDRSCPTGWRGPPCNSSTPRPSPAGTSPR